PLAELLLGILWLAAWNALVLIRLKSRATVTPVEILVNLIIDIAVLSWLFYWTGGYANPFVSLYLVPIALAFIILPGVLAWSIVLTCVAAYSLLAFTYVPLPHVHGGPGADFAAHLKGMWVNFVVSAVLIAVFTAILINALRRREKSLATVEQKALRDEEIIAISTAVTGAAHDLGTPLSTMAALIEELKEEWKQTKNLTDDLTTLENQLNICRTKLQELLKQSKQSRCDEVLKAGLNDFLDTIFDEYRRNYPELDLVISGRSKLPEMQIASESSLRLAIMNILNNAAEASFQAGRNRVRVEITLVQDNLEIKILDEGSGLSEEVIERAGEIFFSTKPRGHGLGLVIANTTINNHGGKVLLRNREKVGADTTITLPVAQLLI
ncbi:MAG: ATP-binding protein, partial [Gammaproteobacteria bacterium]|nr:ATP-binding protein [Gammaproteobacteria bacterium]